MSEPAPAIFMADDQEQFESRLIQLIQKQLANYENATAWRTMFRLSLDQTIYLYGVYSSACDVVQRETFADLCKHYDKATKSRSIVTISSTRPEGKDVLKIRVLCRNGGDQRVLFECEQESGLFETEPQNVNAALTRMFKE